MAFKEIDAGELSSKEAYHLLTSLVVPRPIAWVSTLSASGVRNLAPHSYFNAISSHPLIVHFTSTGTKDSLVNAKETAEFVVNIVSRDLVEEMNLTAANFPSNEDEFSWARLEDVPSRHVKPPRVARAKAAFECKVIKLVTLGNGTMVFGEVLRLVIDESVMNGDRVDPELLAPIGRLGGSTYVDVENGLFNLKRPSWDDLKDSGSANR